MGLTIHYSARFDPGEIPETQKRVILREHLAKTRQFIAGMGFKEVGDLDVADNLPWETKRGWSDYRQTRDKLKELGYTGRQIDLAYLAGCWHTEIKRAYHKYGDKESYVWYAPIETAMGFFSLPTEGSESLDFAFGVNYQNGTLDDHPCWYNNMIKKTWNLVPRWKMSGFCKTIYAGSHLSGLANFLFAHIAACEALRFLHNLPGMKVRVYDESEYYRRRNFAKLVHECGNLDELPESFSKADRHIQTFLLGAVKDQSVFFGNATREEPKPKPKLRRKLDIAG